MRNLLDKYQRAKIPVAKLKSIGTRTPGTDTVVMVV